MNPREVAQRFSQMFTGTPAVFRAPGRVNLIGEHTDYNQGYVLPVAASLSCWAAVSPRSDETIHLHSQNLNATFTASLRGLEPAHDWTDYVLGVAAELLRAGFSLTGANLYLAGDIPLGAGLSSSAAIEIAVAQALLGTISQSLAPKAVALLCQRAENNFVSAKCGVMDQFASCLGKAGHALFLDCRSLDYELVRLPDDISLVVCNSMRKHELSSGEYNLRRRECKEGVERLQQALPDIRALRDVSMDDLLANQNLLPDVIFRRCRHVISENHRVQRMVEALRASDFPAMPLLMAESHASLRDDFEVSTPELDALVTLAYAQKGLLGTRMMGGGFGGSTVNLVRNGSVSDFSKQISQKYLAATGQTPEIYICTAAEGAAAYALPGVEAVPAEH